MRLKFTKKFLCSIAICSMLISTTGCSFLENIPFLQPKAEVETTTPEEAYLQEFYNEDLDENGDEDSDGVINKDEIEFGTSVYSIDTDKDGLNDYDEINVYKTNPLVADTDEDGLLDGVEIAKGLDPLNKKTDGQTLDSEVTFEEIFDMKDATLEVTGNANITTIYADTLDYVDVNNVAGVVSDLYEFYMDDMNFDSATLTLSYDKDLVESYGYNEETLSIYQYMDDGTLKKVDSTIDFENHTVTTTLEHFSKYVIADESNINEEQETNVFLLLDNSGSMYSKEDCEASDENDVEFKRVDMAKTLIEMSDDSINYGLAKFTASYMELNGGFNNEKEDLYASLDSIKTDEEDFNGTFIAKSLKGALQNFDGSKKDKNFIVLLTDGYTTESWFNLYDETDAIKDANEKNVSIIVIGLGNNIDTAYLKSLADNTNGLYVYANNANALEDVYELIQHKINNNYVDTDGDGVFDSIICADSGFNVKKDGFSFPNYTIIADNGEQHNGQCFGLATIAQLYYAGKLPLTGSAVEEHQGGGFIGGDKLSSNAYDISEISFFANEGSKYANNRNNLNDFTLFANEFQEVLNADTQESYQRNEENSNYLEYTEYAMSVINKYTCLQKRTIPDKGIEYIWDGDKKPYTQYDFYQYTINEELPEETSQEEIDTYNFLKAAYNLYTRQGLDEGTTYCVTNADLRENAQQEMFDKLVEDLESGIVPIAGANGHAVNAIKLYRDIENPMEYKLILYDNNQPNKEKCVTIEKYATGLSVQVVDWLNDYRYEIYDTDNVFGKNGKNISVDFTTFVN